MIFGKCYREKKLEGVLKILKNSFRIKYFWFPTKVNTVFTQPEYDDSFVWLQKVLIINNSICSEFNDRRLVGVEDSIINLVETYDFESSIFFKTEETQYQHYVLNDDDNSKSILDILEYLDLESYSRIYKHIRYAIGYITNELKEYKNVDN
jgi:hypothetical protein